jgi:hypothetical protein
MTGRSEENGPPHGLGDEERAPEIEALLGELDRRLAMDWVGDHLPQVRQSAYGQRSLYWALGVGFVVGLAAYTGGYALKSSVTTEPLAFVGDLLHARLGPLDRCRRGPVPPGASRGKATWL